VLDLKDVNVYYGAVHALKGLSLNVEEGEIVTLIGSNGAGKSTTIKAISGIVADGPIAFSRSVREIQVWRAMESICKLLMSIAEELRSAFQGQNECPYAF
jgi:branched-chain amino acid transport system ATP-binding protein